MYALIFRLNSPHETFMNKTKHWSCDEKMIYKNEENSRNKIDDHYGLCAHHDTVNVQKIPLFHLFILGSMGINIPIRNLLLLFETGCCPDTVSIHIAILQFSQNKMFWSLIQLFAFMLNVLKWVDCRINSRGEEKNT